MADSEVKLEIQRTNRLIEKMQLCMTDVQAQVHDIKIRVAGSKEMGIVGLGDMFSALDGRVKYLESARGSDLVEKEKEKLRAQKKIIGSFLFGGASGAATTAGVKTGFFAKIISLFS